MENIHNIGVIENKETARMISSTVNSQVGIPFLSRKCSSIYFKETIGYLNKSDKNWSNLEDSLMEEEIMILFMPWCNRSSHSAEQLAAGLSGPPGLDILGVSAC